MRDWARWCRRALAAAGVLALVAGGVSIFGQPDREVLYQPEPPLAVCGEHGCTFLYRLEVGNSGAASQDEVVVRLRRDVVEAAILPVKARDYGKIERPVRVWDEGDLRAYALGRVESRERVELGFVLRGPTRDALVPWTRILAGVEAPGSKVTVGSAGWTMVLRAWLAIFRVF
ncbi:MAG TPA: hypothetical protein VIE44_11445 [Methylomirabilota bacterium]